MKKQGWKKREILAYLSLLNSGNERGLNYFYAMFYRLYLFRAIRATKDTCIAESIVQEAFLKLWLYRENVSSLENLGLFLKKQIRTSVNDYYQKSNVRFHRNLLRLDDIVDYQEFLLGYEIEEVIAEDSVYLDELEIVKKKQLSQLEAVLPSLRSEQKLFIELCLKYSFNYERIAYHLGGISDYEVGLQIDKTITTLRSVFQSSDKMEVLNTSSKIISEGTFATEQVDIFRMRYELQFSFEKIAEHLNLNTADVKKLFIAAHLKIKESKQLKVKSL